MVTTTVVHHGRVDAQIMCLVVVIGKYLFEYKWDRPVNIRAIFAAEEVVAFLYGSGNFFTLITSNITQLEI